MSVTAKFLASFAGAKNQTGVSQVSIKREMNDALSGLSSSARQRSLHSHQQSLALPQQLQVSGMRVLLALGFAACSMGALMWLFIRHWLFAL